MQFTLIGGRPSLAPNDQAYWETIEGLKLEVAWLRRMLTPAVQALRDIKDRKNQVCANYELCEHVGCTSSYEAYAIADKAMVGIDHISNVGVDYSSLGGSEDHAP